MLGAVFFSRISTFKFSREEVLLFSQIFHDGKIYSLVKLCVQCSLEITKGNSLKQLNPLNIYGNTVFFANEL